MRHHQTCLHRKLFSAQVPPPSARRGGLFSDKQRRHNENRLASVRKALEQRMELLSEARGGGWGGGANACGNEILIYRRFGGRFVGPGS